MLRLPPSTSFFPYTTLFRSQNILTLLGTRLAIAIENARLFEQVKAQTETLLVLTEVGRETSAILDVEELLRRAAEQTKRVIDYRSEEHTSELQPQSNLVCRL